MNTRKVAAAIALLGVIGLAGCSAKPATEATVPGDRVIGTAPAPAPSTPVKGLPAGGSASAPAGFAYNKMTFEVIPAGSEPQDILRLVQNIKDHAAEKTTVIDGATYAVITAGERSTGGYSVEVQSMGDSEGKLEIVYAVKKPAPGMMVTQAISYPYTVIKFQNTANLPVIFRAVNN